MRRKLLRQKRKPSPAIKIPVTKVLLATLVLMNAITIWQVNQHPLKSVETINIASATKSTGGRTTETNLAAVEAASPTDPPVAIKDPEPPIAPGFIVKKSSGPGWAMWRGAGETPPEPLIAPSVSDYECQWTTFRASSGRSAPMCVHSVPDLVSGDIIRSGRWFECPSMINQYRQVNPPGQFGTVMEIGANIGACTMDFLHSTNAHVVVFEPNPRNILCLTHTVSKLPKEIRERFTLFPIAGGDAPLSSEIYGAVGNLGNSVVGKEIKDTPGQQMMAPMPIYVERLDDILDLDTENAQVSLTKMDVQGFECRVMDGMPSILKHIRGIRTEASVHWLVGQGCSAEGLCDRIRNAGYDIFVNNRLLPAGVPRDQAAEIFATQRAQ